MASIIKTKESKSKRTKCSCCGDVIPTCQKYWVCDGDKYCITGNCHTRYLPLNCPGAVHEDDMYEDAEQKAEIERETYARYQANGCTSSFWTDKDAGYI